MEVANWIHGMIDIQLERAELVSNGYTWPTIYQMLDDKYRKHQKKRLLFCQCCGEPVEMVLNKDKVCFFRHYKGVTCPGSDNYPRYRKSREVENDSLFRVGKQIIRTYLEGIYLPLHATIRDGYTYREKLKCIPDLVVQLADGRELAIDFITGLKGSDEYHRDLLDRVQSYAQHGFISYFFIDESWMSLKDKNYMSLYKSEMDLVTKTKQDVQLQDFMNTLYREEEGRFLRDFIRFDLHPFEVQSILYVDVNDKIGHIARHLNIQNSGWAYLPFGKISIPFSDFFKVDEGSQLLSFSEKNEGEYYDGYHADLIMFVAESENERIRKEAERRKKDKELERLAAFHKKRSQDRHRRPFKPSLEIVDIRSPEQIKRDDQRRIQRVVAGLNPDSWSATPKTPQPTVEKEPPVEDKKRSKLLSQFANKRFQGEAYIQTTSEIWKRQLFELVEKEPTISAEQALGSLFRAGLLISQSSGLVKYTITEAIEWIKKNRKL
ncbi:hypothetical protein [Brevibacillus reuszeri]|uniref:hypothetical protein n=1 Tax=Brevibacillus reuszeri TaxID=54915 RepID=UPI000CCC5244|nr:hypothetical protein [Brevibacillus reuszeri]